MVFTNGKDEQSFGGEVYYGTLVHSTKDISVDILPNHAIGVQNGKVKFVEPLPYDETDLSDLKRQYDMYDASINKLEDQCFLSAGFVDTHIHAPQYAQTGTNMDLPLLQWLNKYTIPLESKYSDVSFAKNAYHKTVKRTLTNGTTTALYFATIHTPATLELVNVIDDLGQRAYVGKVNMDRNSIDSYTESTSTSLKDTNTFIQKVLSRKNSLITPVICPRFAPTCSDDLLQGLGELADHYDLPITSHICESKSEISWVSQLFPWSKHYTDVYHKHGLLRNKTVMAHGVYLSDSELALFKKTGASVAHCANSNASLRSGTLDLRNLLDKHIKVGLGTDVSGGYSSSMLDAQRTTVTVSNTLAIEKGHHYQPIDWKEAYRLATLGGAEAMGLDNITGNFEVGKDFDALLINSNVPSSAYDIFESIDGEKECVQKFLHLGDDRNITKVYVSGKQLINP